MDKKWKVVMATICYILGVLASIYVGGWIMLIKPIRLLMFAYSAGTLSLHMLVVCIVKIALSTTVGGLVWCVGYIACNCFRGTEDEYDRILAKERKRIEERKARRKEKEAHKLEQSQLKDVQRKQEETKHEEIKLEETKQEEI